MPDDMTLTALWWAVIFSGVYHGVNPGMGWPLAVSAALMTQKPIDLVKALGLLSAGHLLAMLAILLPFSMMIFLVDWEVQIRVGAGCLVMAMGIYLLINPRHPRYLARVHPARLGLWSFLAAVAHGAGLMLVPIYLGICAIEDTETGHLAAQQLMAGDVQTALKVAFAHTIAMAVSGGVIAVVIYRWLGLKFLSLTWFNLDRVWAVSLVLVGAFGTYSALFGH